MARRFIQFILYALAKLVLLRYRPTVIAITGSVGKTSTKDAIATVLAAQYHWRVRKTAFNFNTEIGVPLAILGLPEGKRSVIAWLLIFARSASAIIWNPKYPEVLVLEMGADKPGNIQYLVKLARPFLGVVTAVGEIPAHVEFFAGPKNLAREKARVVEALPPIGFAVLNFDDDTVLDMRERTHAHVITFGFGDGADVRATALEFHEEAGRPDGLYFKIEYAGKIVPVRLSNVFGKGAVYAALAAAAVGIAMKMHLVEIAEALSAFESPPGRLRLIEGEKNTTILDDTYNASPLAMVMALETLGVLAGKRKIAVLGDMLELGKYTEAAHRSIGEKAVGIADVLITVGERARFIADEARARNIRAARIHSVSTAVEAAELAEQLLREGDLVLVKGSRAMKMERVVEAIMAHPEEAGRILVSQNK